MIIREKHCVCRCRLKSFAATSSALRGPSLEREGCARSGHVTGQRSLRGRGSRKGLQRAPTNTMLFSDYHSAKLNPKCHMNYSIIFTEISFSPETSITD